MFSLKSSLVGAAASLLIGGVSAIPLPDSYVQLSDNDAEYLINANGSTCDPGTLGTDCILGVGDRLRGQFDIQSIEGLINGTTLNTPFGGDELTGIIDIVVTGKSGGPGAWAFTFAPANTLGTAGAAVEMYSDPSQNYTRIGCATTALCEATAKDGSLWAAFGFGANSFWSATAVTDDISVIGSIIPPATGGGFNVGMDFLVNNTGYLFNKQECLFTGSGLLNDVCASGSLLGTAGANTPYDSFSNVDFTLRPIPEPASLALLGAGLLALVGMRRRRQS